MNIGETAKASGISAKMIRYYESVGLITSADRSHSGYRIYSDRDVQVLNFIRRSRDLGFKVEDIRDLLKLWRDRGRKSANVKKLALGQIASLKQKIVELEEMVGTLQLLADSCSGDQKPGCSIIEELETGTSSHRKPTSRKLVNATYSEPAAPSTSRGRAASKPITDG